MNLKIEYEIGETFIYEGIELTVQASPNDDNCNGCYFNDNNCCNAKCPSCTKGHRKDKTNVIFAKMGKPKPSIKFNLDGEIVIVVIILIFTLLKAFKYI